MLTCNRQAYPHSLTPVLSQEQPRSYTKLLLLKNRTGENDRDHVYLSVCLRVHFLLRRMHQAFHSLPLSGVFSYFCSFQFAIWLTCYFECGVVFKTKKALLKENLFTSRENYVTVRESHRTHTRHVFSQRSDREEASAAESALTSRKKVPLVSLYRDSNVHVLVPLQATRAHSLLSIST